MYHTIKELVKAEESVSKACEHVVAADGCAGIRKPRVDPVFRKRLNSLHVRLHEIRMEVMSLAGECGKI